MRRGCHSLNKHITNTTHTKSDTMCYRIPRKESMTIKHPSTHASSLISNTEPPLRYRNYQLSANLYITHIPHHPNHPNSNTTASLHRYPKI